MRLIGLILSVAIIWFLVETYLERSLPATVTVQENQASEQQGDFQSVPDAFDRAGVADVAPQSGTPIYTREMQKAKNVEQQLQQSMNKKMAEIESRSK